MDPKKHITIKQATALTGKSEATIRRLIKKATARKPKKAIKKNSSWLIEEEFLINQLGIEPLNKTDPKEDPTIQALVKQLEIKDKQIEELHKTIAMQIEEANKRQSEANMLQLQTVKALQQLQDNLFSIKQIEDKKPNIFRRLLGK